MAAEWVEKLKTSGPSLNLFLTGPAGGGKSGCLYEIVKGLVAANMPVLSFRLDRVEPVISTIALGEELHLPDSPAVSLARAFPNRPIILVVDQLDFVSTTSGRNPDFFDTLSALCDEVRGLRQYQTVHLVLACREFDFEHDHRFRQFLGKDEKPISISRFTLDEVRQIIGAAASRLSARQLDLLSLPQNLALFVESGLSAVEQPSFVTQKELFDAYWDAKQKEVARRRPSDAQLWLPLIEKLTAEMSEKQDLSVPKSKFDEFSPDFMTLMVSEGVLTWDGRRYGFGHESFFDYCFARRAVAADVEFVAVLEADQDQQHLFRRAQLRQVLVYLREADFDRYLKNVQHALDSNRIRPHLKLLVWDLIANFPDPGDREFELLLPRIESELAHRKAGTVNPDKLASRSFEAFYSSRNLFLAADRLEHLSRWINSGEPWLVNLMTMYLRWQVEHHAERVAEIIEPFVGKDDEWRSRLRYMMEWGNLEKHRRFFDLFLVLLEDGTLDEARDRFVSNGTFWNMLHGLSKARPAWCAEVAGKWLARQVVRSKTETDGAKLMQLHDGSGVHELYETARRAPEAVLDHVLPSVIQAAEAWPRSFHEGLPTDNVWLWRTGGGQYIGMDRAFPGACGTAFDELAKSDPEKMGPAIARLRASRCDSANHLLMDAYLQVPVLFTEEAMKLLADEPDRLFCGFPGAAVWVSGCLIKACSPHCSAATFEKLEPILRNFVSAYESGENGEKYRGHLAYKLCSALPAERTSPETKAKIAEWALRFKAPDAAPPEVRIYHKISPIRKETAATFSGDQWLQAIAAHNTERGEFNSEHPEYGGSIQLSGVMGELMKESPERFARLGLRLPLDAEMYYWTTMLRGAASPAVPDGLKLELAQRAFDFPDQGRLKATLDLLAGVITGRLSDPAIAFIKRMATYVDSTTELETSDSGADSSGLLVTGINTIRGNASHTMCELICRDRAYAEIFREAIDQLGTDNDISVRAAACGLLLPLASIDIAKAFAFLERLAQPDERLLASGQAEEFLSVYLEDQTDSVRPHIVRMMQSSHDDVRKIGAQFACLARLYHEEEMENAELAMAGDQALRLGACEVARMNLAHSACRDWCAQALTRFFSDEDVEVRRLAAGGFWALWQAPDESLLPIAV